MGYGDYIHWTAIIRDLYNDINNSPNLQEKINKIQNYQKNNNKGIGIINFICRDKNINFKFNVQIIYKGNIFDHKQAKIVFKNNPKVTNDESYPNIINLLIQSDGYVNWENGEIKSYMDDIHVVDRYASKLGIKNYSLHGELFFTEEEENNVKKYLPEEEFILIEAQNHKKEQRSYSFEKIQKIVDKFHKKIKFIQVSPIKFADKESRFLKNCQIITDLSYRENILMSKYCKLAIVPEGGLSNGFACTNAKTICIYLPRFNPRMTSFPNFINIDVTNDGNHIEFNNFPNRFNEKVEKLINNHDENEIMIIFAKQINLLIDSDSLNTFSYAECNESFKIKVSNGEIIDKFTILKIKEKKLNMGKKKFVTDEILVLQPYVNKLNINPKITNLTEKLLSINNKLWNIEDSLREKEKNSIFDESFIELARSVYKNNDERAKVKLEINKITNSQIIEMKSYI